MREDSVEREAWVKASVQALRQAGSWTGRIHIHKLLFTIQALGLAQPPFRFDIYHYGPYSLALDDSISMLEATGKLDHEYPKPDYGPRYNWRGEGEPDLNADEIKKIEEVAKKVADVFGKRNSKELELIATCIWVEKREGESDEENIVARMHELKPKYDVRTIKDHLAKKASVLKDLLTT